MIHNAPFSEQKDETYKVCIPHPNCVLDANLSHKQTIHPPEAELHVFNAFVLKVLGKTCVYSGCQIS